MTIFRLPSRSLLAGLGLYLGLMLCAWVYWPGLDGPFLFDDYANLEPLGDNNQVNDLRSFIQFVLSGEAGPTGRPIALLSFLLNAVSWPTAPWSFKYTNLLVHLLNGVLVFWVSLKLCRINSRDFICRNADWLALASACLWLLHPLLVSTTLYVIQRMTMLAALFSLCGLLVYLQGRERLQTHPRWAYGLMTVAVSVFTVLAIFSKENGAVLPLLLATVEFTVLRQQTRLNKIPHKLWTLIFFGLPALAVAIYLGRLLTPDRVFTVSPRGYSTFERGLTESRVLLHYLYDLLVPKLYSGSLYNDDFPISTGLLTPPATALAFIAILALLALAVKVRRSHPLVSLAILFFFVGHVLESTVMTLDLYYEHRNYLPSIFLFLPLAYVAECRPKQTLSAILVALLIFSGFTHAKAKLWSSEPVLLIFWGQQHPNSARAQRHAANAYFKLGQYDKALDVLQAATDKHPEDFKLRLHRIVISCLVGKPDKAYLTGTMRLMEKVPVYFDSHIFDLLEQLTNLTGTGQCPGLSLDELKTMTETILANQPVKDNELNVLVLTHLKGLIALQMNDKAAALSLFADALKLSGAPETGLLQTSLLASHGFYAEALAHLADSEKLLDITPVIVEGVLSTHDYPMEIKRLRQQIQQDMSQPHLPPSTVNAPQSKP
jgi:tetratricopeptide (TPR) repeat protein